MAFAGGTGTVLDPYLVATAEQLNEVRNYLTSYFLQIADIDLSGYASFPPIGDNYNNCFTGMYNGGSFSINNFSQTKATTYGGLFGYIWPNSGSDPATLKNIFITNAVVNAYSCTGILMGYGRAKIENCHAGGSITATNGDCGGLIGSISGGSSTFTGHIYDSSSSATVVVAGGDVGGIAGYLECADVQRCYNTGNVTGGYNVGGFAGMVSGSDYTWVLKDCYTTGTVTGTSKFAGVYSELGGFAGAWYYQAATNCYSASTVVNNGGGSLIGAFIGDYDNSDAPITSCYYDSTLCALANTTAATSKTTEEMKLQVTFVDWDFANVWGIYTGYYPFISGSPDAPEPPAPPEPPPTYYDRIVICGLEVELLNRANIGDAIVLWMNNHKVKTLDFYNNGLNVVYADNTAKSLSYTVDELGQINKISDASDSSEVNISWHNTEL